MNSPIENALEQVKNAFAFRTRPHFISHCGMCYTEEQIVRFLAIPYAHLIPSDMHPILRDGYMCWGTWHEIAYYVPRLLEFYAAGTLDDEEQLYAKLLLAVRPELGMPRSMPRIGEKMTETERKSVFNFVAAVFESRLAAESEYDKTWIMLETVGFLAAFDQPIEPILTKLADSTSQRIRANICLFLAEKTLSPIPFSNWSVRNLILLPENEVFLKHFLSATYVSNYLLQHADDVAVCFKDQEATRDFAFDWAIKIQVEETKSGV